MRRGSAGPPLPPRSAALQSGAGAGSARVGTAHHSSSESVLVMWVLEEEFYLPSPESPGREDDPAQVRPRDLAYTRTLPTPGPCLHRDLAYTGTCSLLPPLTLSPFASTCIAGGAVRTYLAWLRLITLHLLHKAPGTVRNSCTSPSMEAIEQPFRWGALTAPLYLTRHREGK